ncbi:hypothetical protein IKG02_01355 [Candidatus Saccharibacteria bacterium]|nr:hypothetical protein [Candidatus Saccharibacteria bacterium]
MNLLRSLLGRNRVLVTVLFFVIVLSVAVPFSLAWSRTAITFLEFESPFVSRSDDNYQQLYGERQIRQEFEMPFDILNSISFEINTFNRVNNSSYEVTIKDCKDNDIATQTINSITVDDNNTIRVIFPRNIAVKRGEKYSLVIRPLDNTSEQSSIGFYYGESAEPGNETNIYYRIYGGNYSCWWTGFACFVLIYLFLVLGRFFYLVINKKSAKNDFILKCLLVFGLAFALSSVFSVATGFTDEYDNMRGGLVIADGGVLYRDYITQHTPFVYYLCSLFARLGARSVIQFRFSFYIFLASVWLFVFIRYGHSFGEKRILALLVAITCILFPLFQYDESRILSDNVQAFCFVILLFEFILYYRDPKHSLDWTRAVVVSLCIYLSVGSAFNSVYTLAGFAFCFFVVEIKYWLRTGITFKSTLKRYYKLISIVILPLFLFFIYFSSKHALNDVIEQAYLFNTSVYSDYLKEGYGSNIIAPFFHGIKNYLSVFKNSILAGLHWQLSFENITNLVFISLSLLTVFVYARQKKVLLCILLLTATCFSFSRDGFHTISAWEIIVFTGIVLFPYNIGSLKKWQLFIVCLMVLFMLVPYFNHITAFVLYKDEPISELEKKVIDSTRDGEEIFLSAYVNDSLYYQYKNRKIANKASYLLPWYMVWYEKTTLSDLESKKPSVVIYDPLVSVWGIDNFAPALSEYIEQNYTQNVRYDLLWEKPAE